MTAIAIMETVSKKLGRPRKYEPEAVALVAGIAAPDVTTDRHKQSRYIAQQAVNMLLNEDYTEFIHGVDQLTGEKFRVTILEQLGRLVLLGVPKEQVIKVARTINTQLATKAMTARFAVRFLRRIRREIEQGPTP